MSLLAVFTERFTVVARDDYDGRAPGGAEIIEQRAESRISRRDLAVVKAARVLPIERRRRPVRRVRVEHMGPSEPRMRPAHGQPGPREGDHLGRWSFWHHEFGRGACFAELVVVHVEPNIE